MGSSSTADRHCAPPTFATALHGVAGLHLHQGAEFILYYLYPTVISLSPLWYLC
jgi:hypothetical protein